MKKYILKNLSESEIEVLKKRPSIDMQNMLPRVKQILNDVKLYGNNAILNYAEKYDGLLKRDIKVEIDEIESSEKLLSAELKSAIDNAYENIYKFHQKQIPLNYEIEILPEIICSRKFRAIENVGLYIPGGSAVLPSTMLMLGIPAKIAGCKRIIACSPAKENKISPAVLYAAKKVGINEFYKIGGAQAIGLMAYGTESIKKVNKIFGPGNQYVTAAKMLVSIDPEGCAIDMPAGPSEVLIIADEKANPKFIAADLLSQAEHGADSQVILISNTANIIENVSFEIQKQLLELPRRRIAELSLENSFSLLVNDFDEALSFSNEYAPEHLILHLEDADSYKEKIINAGSVFLGEYSPESAGDYASGTNHTLPTYGYAKSYSGVSVESFMKAITFQKISKEGLKKISRTIEALADEENLQAHKNAISIRLI